MANAYACLTGIFHCDRCERGRWHGAQTDAGIPRGMSKGVGEVSLEIGR